MAPIDLLAAKELHGEHYVALMKAKGLRAPIRQADGDRAQK